MENLFTWLRTGLSVISRFFFGFFFYIYNRNTSHCLKVQNVVHKVKLWMNDVLTGKKLFSRSVRSCLSLYKYMSLLKSEEK